VEWDPFVGYPDSLALAVIDSIWSMISRYAITRGVIERYTRHRGSRRADAHRDGLRELLEVYQELDGADGFIDAIGTRNRVSTQRDAVRKGAAVFEAAQSLVALGLDSAEQFRAADGTEFGEQLKDTWLKVPGQSSGISWRYLRMLVGLPDVKPDRMIIRFVATALGIDEASMTPDEAGRLVTSAAQQFDVDVRVLDHEIWEFQTGERGGHDPASRADHLRSLAQAFIGAAFPALAKVRVVPPPVYHRYLQVGRDYYGDDVAVPEGDELIAALENAYPDRFSEPLKRREGAEFANSYVHSLLEAAVIRCAIANQTFEADTPAVTEAVEELFAVLDAEDYIVHCCRAVSHITTKDMRAARIGDVTIYPETETGKLVHIVKDLIPASPGAYNRDDPRPHDPPHSLIVASATASKEDPFTVADRLSGAIGRFMLLARLLYAGTHQSQWQITGQATLVSRAHPQYQLLPGAGTFSLRMRRNVVLSDDQAPAFAALGNLLEAADVKRKGMASTSFDLARYEYNRSFEPGHPEEHLVALATALEAILTGSESNTEAVLYRLRNRAATILATNDDTGSVIFRDVGKIYDLRSRLVHGGGMKEKDLRKMLESVSTVKKDAMFGFAWAFAVDRLRDLVRRAFLARLCLAEGSAPIWPFDGETSVDERLADHTQRELWRRSWRDRLVELGVGEAAEAAPAAIDPLDDQT